MRGNNLIENFTIAANISIYHKYVHSPDATTAQLAREAIEKGHHVDKYVLERRFV